MKFHLLAVLALFTLVSFGASPAVAADASPRVIKVRAGVENTMKFDVATISAAPGETVKVVLTNACSFPKTVMGHNWVLLTKGTDINAFAMAGAAEAANGYIPEKQKSKVIAMVSLLGPNESGEVIFQVPSEPGEYPFLCTFPAHCSIGMKGMFIVKK
ncbi:MAG: plastocyanin/azurin family copper-binding protein [Opitutaceae bacterium]